MSIEQKLANAITTQGDINEHLVYLTKLSSECSSILECGVRTVVSSWAFLNGLTLNKTAIEKRMTSCDLDLSPNIGELKRACIEHNVNFNFFQGNDLDIPMQPYDLIFIDTWHIYGQLKRELQKMHTYATKYIVMHDTEVDKINGESIRCGFNTHQQSIDSGYPEYEIRCGLERAIKEFLVQHPEWKIKEHFTHNNGLTVLERVA